LSWVCRGRYGEVGIVEFGLMRVAWRSFFRCFSVDNIDNDGVASGSGDELLSGQFAVLVAIHRLHNHPRTGLSLGVSVSRLLQSVDTLTIAPQPTVTTHRCLTILKDLVLTRTATRSCRSGKHACISIHRVSSDAVTLRRCTCG